MEPADLGQRHHSPRVLRLDRSRLARVAEDGIAVAKQVARQLIKQERLSQLLPRPFRRRMSRHIAVENATPVMSHYQKHVKNMEAKGRHGKEVDGDQLLGVILQEGAPRLRRRLATADHVFADPGLADVDAELAQLPVNAGCTPTRILPAHPADQIANLAGNDRSSGLAAPDLPSPEKAEACTMPGKDRLGLNDGQRRAPAAPHARQPDPEEAVAWSQPGTFSRGMLQHADLVA